MSNRKLRIKEIPSKAIFHQANLFLECAKLIHRNDTNTGKYSPVIITLLGFSIELFFKSLNSSLVFENGSEIDKGVTCYEDVFTNVNAPKSHYLIDLFEASPKEYQKILANEFLKLKSFAEYKSIKEILTDFNSCFVTFRYIYEKKISKPFCITDYLTFPTFYQKPYMRSDH